ncbi:MAG: hypothetical protein GVY13_04320 [Alphaproteobacteria bacterium]|jgi:hypothetical protein|nr:hypothetical protein [Alphaproteobacteria bacterium]
MSPSPPKPIALLLSRNDLEAVTAADLAERHGVRVLDLRLKWGERPEAAPGRVDIESLPPTVILMETPGRLEQTLRDTGRTVHRIDHHAYVDPLTRHLDDRTSPLASLEQLAALLGAPLSPLESWIAANDRGFWAGLRAAIRPREAARLVERAADPAQGDAPAWLGAGRDFLNRLSDLPKAVADPLSAKGGPTHSLGAQSQAGAVACLAAALAIRLREHAVCRAFGADRTADELMADAAGELRTALAWVDEHRDGESGRLLELGDRCGSDKNGWHKQSLWLAAAPPEIAPRLPDALCLRTAIDAIGEGHAPRPVQALCLTVPGGNPGAEPTEVFWSGGAGDWPLVRELIRSIADPEDEGMPAHLARLTVFGGGSADSCFWGAKAPPIAGDGAETGSEALSELADLWLDNVIGLARPLRRWSLRFFQVLDYDPMSPVDGSTGEPRPPVDPRPTCWAHALLQPYELEEDERLFLYPHLRRYFAPKPQQKAEDDGAKAGGIPNLEPDRPVDGGELPILSYAVRKKRYQALMPALAVAFGTPRADEHAFGSGDTRRIIEVPVSELIVHFCFNRLVVLEWAAQDCWDGYDNLGKPKGTTDRPARHWRRLLQSPLRLHWANTSDRSLRTFGQLLDFSHAARQCYSPYKSNSPTQQIGLRFYGQWTTLVFTRALPAKSERPEGWFAALVETLLGPFRLGDVRIIGDERARVMIGAGVGGCTPTLPTAIRRRDAMMARLADVTAAGMDYPYSPPFNKEVMAEIGYRRFDVSGGGDGTLFAVDDHAVVCLTYGGFGSNYIVARHMNTVYRRLYLIAQFHAAVFHKFSRTIATLSSLRLQVKSEGQADGRDKVASRLSDAVRDRIEKAVPEAVEDLRLRFLGFANGLWFEDVSPQMQGRDLFSRMQNRLQVRPLYQEMQDELERTNAIEQREKAARNESRFEVISSFAALFAFAYAVFDVLDILALPSEAGFWWRVLALLGSLVAGYLAAVITHCRITGDTFGEGAAAMWRKIGKLVPRLCRAR